MISILHHTEPASHIAMVMDNLGRSADEVAAELRSRGIVGVRNTVRFLNPLIRFLQEDYQTIFRRRASMDVIKGDILRVSFLDGDVTEVSLSDAVADFLEAFDRGTYPDLIEHLD